MEFSRMDVVIFSPINSSSNVRLLLLLVLLLPEEKHLVGVQVSLLFTEVSFPTLVGDKGTIALMVALLLLLGTVLVGGMVSHRQKSIVLCNIGLLLLVVVDTWYVPVK